MTGTRLSLDRRKIKPPLNRRVLRNVLMWDCEARPSISSDLVSQLLGQLFIDGSTVANGHQANDSCFLMYGIDDTKAANAILSQPVEFPLERLSTVWIGGNGANGGLDQLLEVGMERADHVRYMRGNIRTERSHAERRFLTGVRGSPNTSSNESPLRFVL